MIFETTMQIKFNQLLTSIYPDLTFTATELEEIHKVLGNLNVRKYLIKLGIDWLKAIANGVREDGQSAESFLQQQAVVQGQLAVIQMLLSIELPAQQV